MMFLPVRASICNLLRILPVSLYMSWMYLKFALYMLLLKGILISGFPQSGWLSIVIFTLVFNDMYHYLYDSITFFQIVFLAER